MNRDAEFRFPSSIFHNTNHLMQKAMKPPLIALFLLLAAAPIVSGAASLDSLIARSWQTHPDLRGMQAMIAAEEARGRMSKSLMNPSLSVGLMELPQSLDVHQDASTAFTVGVMQRIPYPGKRRLASDAAAFRTEAARLDFESSRQRMAAMTAMAFYEVAGLIEIDSLLREGEELMAEMESAALRMLAAGMAPQSDVERAKLELENWKLEIIANQGELKRRQAGLAALVGGERDSTAFDSLRLTPDLPVLPDFDSTVASGALERAPTLLAALARRESARSDLARISGEWAPDFDLMVQYGLKPYLRVPMTDASGNVMVERMRMDNMISLELSFPVPLFAGGNQEAAIAEFHAMENRSISEAETERLDLERRLRQIFASWEEENNCCAFVQQSLIGRAKELYSATLIDYQAGKTSYMQLSQARMSLLMAQMELSMSRAKAWGFRAEWMAELGLWGKSAEVPNE